MTALPPSAPGLEAIRDAAARFGARVERTPVRSSDGLDELVGARLYCKCENLQRTGSFKIRGATNAVQTIAEAVAARGVVTHSSGNHGAALAAAARDRGIPAVVVMPRTAPRIKQRRVAELWADVVLCEPTQQARESTAAEIVAATGATLVHPFDDPVVIAGQGTVALELLEEVPDLDLLLAPIGGGGLLAGTAIACSALASRCRVVGVEPAGAADAVRSLAAGRIMPVAAPATIADGLLMTIGDLPFAILAALGAQVVTVEEESIHRAQEAIAEHLDLVVEPSAAVPLAALLEARIETEGRRVGLVLTGGNTEGAPPTSS